MKKELFLIILLLIVASCQHESFEEGTVNVYKEEHPTHQQEVYEEPQQKEFRLEIPTETERATLPKCDMKFSTFPVDMNEVTAITPLGNLGPPGHTFPTQHPHLHFDGSGTAFNIYSPADVYLTTVAWSDGISSDPRDYTIYFALCQDIIAYYNHVKTVSPELQAILDTKKCESFSVGDGCTKVLDLNQIKAGNVMGTVGHKQGNWDFGLIDLRKPLNYIKPERHSERDRYLQCAFDYYPKKMKNTFYSLIERHDGTCGKVMQDIPETLKGNWFHKTAQEEYVVEWDLYLAFVDHFEYANVQVVSVAGKFTNPGLWHFTPRDEGTINRNFSQTTPGTIYCYQSEDVGYVNQNGDGKIIVELLDEETLRIEHQSGTCTETEQFTSPEVYQR